MTHEILYEIDIHIEYFKINIVNFGKLSLAGTPEIGQSLGRILSCGARKPEQT